MAARVSAVREVLWLPTEDSLLLTQHDQEFFEDIDVQSSSSSMSDDEFYLAEQPPLVTMPMTAMTKITLTHLTQLIVVRHH